MSQPRSNPTTKKKKAPAGSKGELEAAIQARIKKELEKHGYLVLRTNSGHLTVEGRHINLGEKGTSDLTTLQPGTGRWVSVECKRLGEKPTPAQQAYLDKVIERGGIGIYADSVEMLRQKLGLPERAPKVTL